MVARILRLLAAAGLAAAGVAVLPAAPATAATCSSASGVSVVIDFSLLGGSVAATCVAGGGGDSAGALAEVDHDLTRIAQFPGAVCKVDGAPADAACQRMPPTDAYWGLFWSDGSGGWVYSSEGVDSLNIPDGGSVALAWQDGGGRDQPGIAPPQHVSTPQPSPSPSPGGGGTHDQGDGNGDQGQQPNGSPSSPAAPSASPTASDRATDAPAGEKGDRDGKRDKRDRRDKGGKASDAGGEDDSAPTPEADPSDAVPASADPPADAGDSGNGALPAWVAPLGIAALFGVAGAVALLRRRTTAR